MGFSYTHTTTVLWKFVYEITSCFICFSIFVFVSPFYCFYRKWENSLKACRYVRITFVSPNNLILAHIYKASLWVIFEMKSFPFFLWVKIRMKWSHSYKRMEFPTCHLIYCQNTVPFIVDCHFPLPRGKRQTKS